MVFLALGGLFSAVVQVWIDHVPVDYPPSWKLWDLGFLFIAHDLPRWGADLALGIVILFGGVRLLVIPLPDGQSRLEVFIRFLWVWGTMVWLRCFTVGLTRFPRLVPTGPLPDYDGLGWNLIDPESLAQADFMFSGHAIIMTLMGLFVSYYTFHHLYSQLFWILVMGGYWAILSARIHYSADVVVAILLSFMVFTIFHLLADPDCLSGWRSVLMVSMPPPEPPMTAPLTLTESSGGGGRTWTVSADDPGPGQGPVYLGRYSTARRRALFRDFVGFLGGHQEHKNQVWQ